MDKKGKKDKKDDERKGDELPLYDVEFIPVERRLKDRRSNPTSGVFGVERRQQGRRKTDATPAEEPAPEAPPPGTVPPGKK